MDGLRQDFARAVRQLMRRPAFTAVALATLALGIGSGVAIFSLVDAVLLRPLPYREPDRLVLAWQADRQRGQPFVEVSYPAFRAWRERGGAVFEGLAGLSSTNQSWVATGLGEPLSVVGRLVSWDFFAVLGVPPAQGRTFAPEDDRTGAAPVVVISHGLWRERFAADPAVVGRSVELDRKPFTVVGVMAPGFAYPKGADLWMPLVPAVGRVAEDPGVQWMIAVGRLRAGVSLEQARRDTSALAQSYAREQHGAEGMSAVLTPLADAVFGATKPALLALLAAVGLVLLVACANVAGLQLVRTSERRRELAVRLALGASPRRLARAQLVESAVLAAASGIAGVLLAWLAIPVLVRLSPQDVPRLAESSLDARACAFAVAAAGAATLLTAAAPVVAVRRRSLGEALLRVTTTVAPGRSRLRALLVVWQMAVALVLLVGAGLLGRSFFELRRVPLGFDADKLLSAEAGLPEGRFDLAHERQYFQELISRAQALPGVESAAAVTLRPLWGEVGMDWTFTVEGQSEKDAARNPLLNFETVSPGYFRTLGIPLRRGRVFDERDRAGQPGVAVVSESFARRYWPGQEPVGKRLSIPLPPTEYDHRWLTVVGVVGDARYRELTASRLDLYMCYLQSDHRLRHLLVRARGDPAPLADGVRRSVRSLAPDLPAPQVITMAGAVSQALAGPRFAARVFAAFSLVATLLSVLGLYGVIAFSVARRTREIGVRMSLGARPADVARLVLGEGLRLAAAGVLLGLAGGLAGTRLLSSLLFNVRAVDGPTFVSAAALLLATTVAACLVPARRAARVQPAVALRHE